MLILSENFALQGLYPRTGTNNSSEFVTYPCGINTYPIYYGNQMMLPRLLLENLLALRGRVNYGGRGGKKNPEFVLQPLASIVMIDLLKKIIALNTYKMGSLYIHAFFRMINLKLLSVLLMVAMPMKILGMLVSMTLFTLSSFLINLMSGSKVWVISYEL
jgi:hypothetical protein